ncbi:MAG: 50S ribosomal protein L32, partial [Armatimonadota bacterium]
MALPKRKTSKSRKRKRRTHQGIDATPAIAYCDHCGAAVLPHNAC